MSLMITAEDLKQTALDLNISHTALLDTSDIQFHEDFRKVCEKNVCGKYNATWMGPPVIGPIRDLKKKVLRFRQGLLLQTVHQVAGSLDMKGMLAAAGEHRAVFRSFLEKIRKKFPDDNFLPLDAGCCSYCEKCAYQDNEPCRNPDWAVSSVEAYGMNVAALMKTAGMSLNHGKEAIGFVGLILFNDPMR
jgi:predicted metal-binding protein